MSDLAASAAGDALQERVIEALLAKDLLISGGRKRIALIARQHGWRWIQTRAEPPCAVPGRGWFRSPPIETEIDLAVGLHELGHLLNGPCPRVKPHLRDLLHGGCVECERLATTRALELVPFTHGMFERLQVALKTYANIVGTPAAELGAAQLINFGWHQVRQQRVTDEQRQRFADKLARQARVNREVGRS